MKKILKTAICTVLILIMIMSVSTVSFPEGEISAVIGGHNIAMEDSISLIYYAKFDNVPAEAETGILIFNTYHDTYEYGDEDFKLSVPDGKEICDKTGVEYDKYYFRDIKAKEMTVNFYAVPFVKDGDDVYYGDLDKYSVLQYAYNKKSSPDVSELVESVLKYGASVQKFLYDDSCHLDRLADDTYYMVSLENCTLEDGTRKGLYLKGDDVSIESDDGYYFPVDESGELNLYTETVISVGEEDTAVTASQPDYKFQDDGDISIEGVRNGVWKENVVIPAHIGGKTVTKITEEAFAGPIVTSVTIPSTVTDIGRYAFGGSLLVSVDIPGTVFEIGDSAFDSCTSLESVVLREGIMSIGDEAFFNCRNENFTEITLPSSLSNIGKSAFQFCSGLKTAVLSEGISSVSENMFSNCTSLETVYLPHSLTQIGAHAFDNCTSLTTIYYSGTEQEWNNLSKGDRWDDRIGICTVVFSGESN